VLKITPGQFRSIPGKKSKTLTMKHGFSIVLCFSLTLALSQTSQAARVKIAIPGFNFLIAFAVAKEKGFYANEGLDVDIILMSSGLDVRSILAGEVEFAGTAASAVNAALTGAPVRVVFGSFNRPMHRLYAQPQIKGIAQLKGKKVGISRMGSGPDFLLREVFKKYGMDADRDVAIVALGSGNIQYRALANRTVDAAVVTPPLAFAADDAGFPRLINFIEQEWVEIQGSIVVTDTLLRSAPALVEKFIRGTLKGLIYTRNNRSGTIPVWARLSKTSETVAGKLYDALRPALSSDGTLSVELQKKSLEPAVNRLPIKETPALDRIYDFGLARKVFTQLETEGWKPR
jgi:ABC-type nitrate/sulfonate/bicarbonate transport system substrate-binding protein